MRLKNRSSGDGAFTAFKVALRLGAATWWHAVSAAEARLELSECGRASTGL
jgi:hypothetical protein